VNRVLEPKRQNAIKFWGEKKQNKHEEELHNLYSSSNNIRMMESKRMDDARKVYNTHGDEK
jgi:hypothetical protein